MYIVLYYRPAVLLIVLAWPFACCFCALEPLKASVFVHISQVICIVDGLAVFYVTATRDVTVTPVNIQDACSGPDLASTDIRFY